MNNPTRPRSAHHSMDEPNALRIRTRLSSRCNFDCGYLMLSAFGRQSPEALPQNKAPAQKLGPQCKGITAVSMLPDAVQVVCRKTPLLLSFVFQLNDAEHGDIRGVLVMHRRIYCSKVNARPDFYCLPFDVI